VNILITGARAPAALHLARLFHAAGHRVVLADTHRFPVSRGTRAASYIRLPAPRRGIGHYADAVHRVVREQQIDLIIPTCEEVFFLAAIRDLHAKPIPLCAPPIAALASAHNKATFALSAVGFGADPPRTDAVTSAAELRGIDDAGSRVLKPVWSRFASRILIRPSIADLSTLLPTPEDPWVVQDYLPGEEICSYGLAQEGRLVAFAAYRPLYRAGLGAGVAFEPVDDDSARRFTAGFAKSTKWTGQLSFDFRRDATGGLHAIECNPRAVSGVHFFAPADNLPAAFLEGTAAVATDRRAMTVPLALLAYGLPQAVRRGDAMGWWRDFRRMGNIFEARGDRSRAGAQLLALGEIGLLALEKRKTLQQAATYDIEWNGEPLG